MSHNWFLRQIEINNDFLQGNLQDFYMLQPSGFVKSSLTNHVRKLNKSIYGPCQASCAWYDELKSYLITFVLNLPFLFLSFYSQNQLIIHSCPCLC